MDAATRRIVHEATRASCEERAPFPEIVAMLRAAGIERYHADLVTGTRTYYTEMGGCEGVDTGHGAEPAARFDAAGVEAERCRRSRAFGK